MGERDPCGEPLPRKLRYWPAIMFSLLVKSNEQRGRIRSREIKENNKLRRKWKMVEQKEGRQRRL